MKYDVLDNRLIATFKNMIFLIQNFEILHNLHIVYRNGKHLWFTLTPK